MERFLHALWVTFVLLGGSAGASTLTYEFTFTQLSWSPLGSTGTSQNFFDLTGITPTDTITATVTFDPKQSYVFPENYSGSDYVYQENYTPWTSFDLAFGNEVYSADPSNGNPYTSIRVRDGISDGALDISDRVLLDADWASGFSALTPNGFQFSQFLISLYSFDESTFSGLSVPTPDILNSLTDTINALSIPVYFQGTALQMLTASQFSVKEVLPGCGPSGGVPPKCNPPGVVPLPASFPMLLIALGGLGLITRGRRSAA